MKYRCLRCEDPCVLEIAMRANNPPKCCPFGDINVKWEEWSAKPTNGVCKTCGLKFSHLIGCPDNDKNYRG